MKPRIKAELDTRTGLGLGFAVEYYNRKTIAISIVVGFIALFIEIYHPILHRKK